MVRRRLISYYGSRKKTLLERLDTSWTVELPVPRRSWQLRNTPLWIYLNIHNPQSPFTPLVCVKNWMARLIRESQHHGWPNNYTGHASAGWPGIQFCEPRLHWNEIPCCELRVSSFGHIFSAVVTNTWNRIPVAFFVLLVVHWFLLLWFFGSFRSIQ